MSSQDVITLIWKLAVALVAVVPILSVIGVWLLARFTIVFDAYAGERAKLQVQFDNVAELVEQISVLTEATEQIKNRVSDEARTKQQRWLKRLKTYGEVIDALHTLRNAADDSMRAHTAMKQSVVAMKPRKGLGLHLVRSKTQWLRFTTATATLYWLVLRRQLTV